MQESQDGKKKMMSKFRMNRYDAAHGGGDGGREPGQRATARANATMPEAEEERVEEQVHPGIHDEVKQVAAEHGPAHTVHITHDHEGQRSHVHSIHPDGHEHHADHDGEMHHVHAHHHHGHAAGVHPEHVGDGGAQGEYPEEHEPPHKAGEEEFEAEPL